MKAPALTRDVGARSSGTFMDRSVSIVSYPNRILLYARHTVFVTMEAIVDPVLIAFCGSETRVLTLGILANSNVPLTGYRVSKITGLQPIKVYRELDRAANSGLVEKSTRGYRLVDTDLRALLQKRIRVSWSGSWFADAGARLERANKLRTVPLGWFDAKRYRANASVALRYAKEFERPPEKDDLSGRQGVGTSRKRK